VGLDEYARDVRLLFGNPPNALKSPHDMPGTTQVLAGGHINPGVQEKNYLIGHVYPVIKKKHFLFFFVPFV
jgi:hypothetical protein